MTRLNVRLMAMTVCGSGLCVFGCCVGYDRREPCEQRNVCEILGSSTFVTVLQSVSASPL